MMNKQTNKKTPLNLQKKTYENILSMQPLTNRPNLETRRAKTEILTLFTAVVSLSMQQAENGQQQKHNANLCQDRSNANDIRG